MTRTPAATRPAFAIGTLVIALVALLTGGAWLGFADGRMPGGDGFGDTSRSTTAAGIDEQDGYVGEQPLSPFAEALPAIANLDAGLRIALQDAARAAADDGVDLMVTSGWRSAGYQQSLLDAAVERYGSRAEAARFVLPPERSQHVNGAAVDVGPTGATSWLQQHGAAFGLCQTYANEPWHFELDVSPSGACPPPRRDASDVLEPHESG